MALLKRSVNVYGKLGELFQKLLEGQAPDKFTREYLRDLGFKSSNWHAAIGLMKGLGFLSSDGSPTAQYMEFLDRTKSKKVLAKAVKEAYGDIFIMKRNPTKSDVAMIIGKYKSTYNMTDIGAERAARTFLALLEYSDRDVILGRMDDSKAPVNEDMEEISLPEIETNSGAPVAERRGISGPVDFNYNIHIHLPATKDIEVYNAIFKSLREHIID